MVQLQIADANNKQPQYTWLFLLHGSHPFIHSLRIVIRLTRFLVQLQVAAANNSLRTVHMVFSPSWFKSINSLTQDFYQVD